MRKLSETEKAYLAGLWDGDGCIYIRTQRSPKGRVQYVMGATLTMTHKPTLKFWAERVGLGSVGILHDGRAKKKSYQWKLAAKKAEELLRILYPYLMVKKDQADIAFRFRDTIGRSSNKSKYKGEELWQHTLDIREELKQELHIIKKKSY